MAMQEAFDPSEYDRDEEGLLDVPLTRELYAREGDVQADTVRDGLDADFATKLSQVIEKCRDQGVVMIPYTGIRDPREQARLWRQSRSSSAVAASIQWLKDNGAPFLAGVLDGVGPQPTGPRVTNALPGFSWHQWGEAMDCYWEVNGGAEWDNLTGYKVYAEVAEDIGLNAGGHWASFKDWPHVQARSAANPKNVFSVPDIDAKMRAKFS